MQAGRGDTAAAPLDGLAEIGWDEGLWRLAGAVSVEADGETVRPWRIFHERLRLYEPALLARAAEAAGVRLTLLSDTRTLAVDVEVIDAADASGGRYVNWTWDLVLDGVLHERKIIPNATLGRHTILFEHLPPGSHRIELYLPQAGTVRLVGPIRVSPGAAVERWDDPRPKWITYGSSITACREAAGPSETWPALVAARFGLNLTCLGFGGQCHIDPMVGRTIGDLPADYITVCLGINTHGGTFHERTFRAAAIGLIQLIRDRHPEVPMVCISPIVSPSREATPGGTGMTLQSMRGWLADAVEALRAHGDRNLRYCDGLTLIGPGDVGCLPDGLHPDADGYRLLAERFATNVMPRLGLSSPAATEAASA